MVNMTVILTVLDKKYNYYISKCKKIVLCSKNVYDRNKSQIEKE